jgi:mono/diheme cytochrome c family protein
VTTNPGGPALLGLLVACGLLWSAPSRALAAEAGPARSHLAQQLFARYCSECHGADGRGEPGRAKVSTLIPDFTNRSWQQTRSNVQLTISILEGKDRLMPANRGMISDQMARDLVAYVRTFAPSPQVSRTEVAPPKPPPSPAAAAVTPTAPTPAPSPSYAATGNFEVDFGNLAKEFGDRQRQMGGPVARAVAPTTPTPAPAPAYAATGDFEVDFNNLVKEFDDLQGQVRALALAPKTPSPPGGAPDRTPTVTAPTVTAPTVSLPEKPPVTEAPGKPAEPMPEKARVAAAPISDRPLTPDDVARGRDLFLGRRALVNGGAACVSCHAVNRGEAREGGRLGPELTKAYERLGGRTALGARLWAPATRTMHPAYLQHSLEPGEVLSLVAYLEDANQHAAADASPLPLKFLLLGLGGAALALVLGTFWGSRSRRPDLAERNGRAVPALPPARPSRAPAPADCVGAGL